MSEPIGTNFRLDGRVAAVTGGASGIGRGAAAAFAAAGARVAVIDIDADAAATAAAELEAGGAEASAHPLDVADDGLVAAGFAAIEERYGRLDVLVNSAGVAAREPAEDMAAATWDRVIAVNLTGAFLCSREAGRRMLAAGSGSIINIASIMGFVGNALYTNVAYHAAKGGLVNLTRTLAVEWAARGVRVNGVAPGFVHTPLTTKLLGDPAMAAAIEGLTPVGRIAEVDDMMGALVFLASDASAMVSGHTIAVDGGWLAR